MSKLIITNIEYNGKTKIFCGLHNDNRFCQMSFSDAESESGNVGDIYVGRVKDIVKNINAAFIEYKKGYVGYLSIDENKNIMFLNSKNTNKLCEGDLVIVQLEKAAVKTKFPVLTSNISISGRNLVFKTGNSGIGYSRKIKDGAFKEKVSRLLENCLENYDGGKNINIKNIGLVVRTNAVNAKPEDIVMELKNLLSEWTNINKTSVTRQCFSVLKKSEAQYLNYIKGAYENEISEIITDSIDVYDEVKDYIVKNYMTDIVKLSFYEDELLLLSKLYSIEKNIEDILNKKVWLKSGAYLVIEQTEAMVVIDVNTGKNIKGRKTEDTILNVNKEAAKEIAYQLRLRNLSGIIMIDFINMGKDESKKELMEYLKHFVSEDKIKTTVVDITKLELVEITRKKIEPPVYEQLV